MLYTAICAAALVGLSSASPTSTGHAVGHGRQLGYYSGYHWYEYCFWNPHSHYCQSDQCNAEVTPKLDGMLSAKICNDLITATVSAMDNGAGKALWTVDIEHIDHSICDCDGCTPGDLNWHIHQNRVEDNTCGDTGGHWDPGLACGGASEFAKTTCKGLDADYISSYGTRCNKDAGVNAAGDVVGQKGCEYGDLSGKMGQIEVRTGTQHFEDKYIQPLETYKYTSIVLHCGKPRKACADFQFH